VAAGAVLTGGVGRCVALQGNGKGGERAGQAAEVQLKLPQRRSERAWCATVRRSAWAARLVLAARKSALHGHRQHCPICNWHLVRELSV
jgi:hypothetical protein